MLKKILCALNWLEETVIAYLLAAMVLLAFVNAVLRRLFNSGFFWSLETTLLLFLILVLFGMAYAARKTLHIAVDAFVLLLPKATAKAVTIFSGIITVIYAGLMAWASYGVYAKFTSNRFLKAVNLDDIPVPTWSVYLMITLCFAYFACTMVYMTFRLYQGHITHLTAAHEASEEEAAALEELKGTKTHG